MRFAAGVYILAAGAALPDLTARAAEPPSYETVVPAPARDEQAAREDVTASASVVTQQRTPRSGESMPQLLSELPGVTVTRYGSHGSLATLSLRGSSPNQVMVYADGVPLNGALVGALDIGLLPLTAAQRIEVYRGQSPLAFGTSAMGGVVSLTTEAPAASEASVHSGVGSFGTRLAGAEAAFAGQRLKLAGRLALFRSRADFPYVNDLCTALDPSDDELVRRENNELDQQDASLRAELDLPGRRELALAAAGIDRDQGLPARGCVRSLAAELHRRRVHASASYQSRDDLGEGGRWKATLYTLASEQRFEDALHEIAFVDTRTRDRSFTAGASAVASQPLAGLLLSLLLDGRHEAFFPHSYSASQQPAPGRRTSGAAGLAASVWLAPLALELYLSGRGELAQDRKSPGHGVFATDPDGSGTAYYFLPVARLGLLQTPHPRLRLRGNAGMYARMPTLFERYGNDGLVKGYADLEPERGMTADVGAAWQLAGADQRTGLFLDGALFASRSRNLIHMQQFGYFAAFRNVGRTRGLGAELSLSARAGPAHLLLQSTFVDLRDRSVDVAHNGRQLPRHPRLRGYARPELRGLALPGGLSLGLYADADVAGPFYYDPNNQVRQRGRVVFGAGGFLAHPGSGLRAVLSAYNLTDHRAPEVLDFPLPGRSLFLTVHLAYPYQEKMP